MDIWKPTAFMEHPKVKEAHRLLVVASREILKAREKDIEGRVCECKHKRKFHGPVHNINYTGGACEKCGCLSYLEKNGRR